MSRLSLGGTTTPEGLSHRGRLGFLLKDSVLYGGASAISRAFSLITFPLLSRHFTVDEYGVLDFFLVLSGFMAILVIFGQDSAVARFFYEHENTTERRQLISQSLVFQLACTALLVPALWCCAVWITPFLVETKNGVWLFRLVLLQLPFLLVINFSQNLLKWTFARAQFLTLSLGFTVVQASLLCLAVLVYDVSLEGVLMVSLLTSSVFGLFGMYFVRGWLERPRNFAHLGAMLPFSIPIGITCVVSAFSPALERSITDQLLGSNELGLYAAGTKVAMLIGLVVTAFQTAWGPFSLSIYKQADAIQTYNWVLKTFALVMCMVVLGLTLIAQPIIYLLASNRYSGAAVVVFPLTMGLAVQATSWITEIGIGIAKRSYLSLYAYVLSIATTLAGILLLAPILGLSGIGFGVLVGQLAKAIFSSWLAQKAHPLAWQYSPVLFVMGMTVFWGSFAIWVEHQWGAIAHSLYLAVGLVTVSVVSVNVLLNREERKDVISMMTSLTSRIGFSVLK